MNEMKQLRCKAIFDSNIEKINPLFSKVKIRIAYTGINRNNSYISKEAFIAALPTIYNCPIIGEFIEVIDDFGSHGGKIEISDQGVRYVHTTKPYGVINESSEITWEDIVEEDGTINTYLCATGYLWTGRYDELEFVIKDSKSQSMEIEIVNGNVQKINGKSVFAIDDFIFSAFCILGSETEPCFESSEITSYNFNKDEFKEEFTKMLEELKQYSKKEFKIDSYWIEKEKAKQLVDKASEIFQKLGFECNEWIVDGKEHQVTGIINKIIDKEASKEWGFDIYNNDTITLHTNEIEQLDISTISINPVKLLLNNKSSKGQSFSLDLKLEDLNFNNINFSKKEDEIVDEKMELLAKYNLTVEQLDFNIDEISLEELEEKLKEFSKSEPDNVVTFSATYRQKREALANALDPKIEKDADGNLIYEEYQWVEDFDDTHVFVEKSIWTPDNHECKYGRFTYTFDDETLTATISGEFEEMVLVWLTLEENQTLQDERDNASTEFQKLKDEFEEYKTNYSTENSEVERLQKFEQDALATQRKESEDTLFSQFDDKLQGIPEYEELKTNASEFELEDLKKECYVILGIQSANNFSKSKDKNKNDKVKLDFSKKIEENHNKVDEFLEKYSKKE